MTELFKLFPLEATIDTKLMVVKDRASGQPIPLNIIGWRRIFPNKISVPLNNPQMGAYQCTALDSNCFIEVSISYKIHDKIINKALTAGPINITKQLRQRSLYVVDSIYCRLTVDQFQFQLKIGIENSKLKLVCEGGKFQTAVNQSLIEIQPFHLLTKINFNGFRNEFLRFLGESFKWNSKVRSSHFFCIFNTKLQQDLFLLSYTECFKQLNSQRNQIKIVGTTTPRNQKQLKNNGSSSSLASNNKSCKKNKEKIKISQNLNLKKSYSKLNSKNENQNKACLDVFTEDNNEDTKLTEQSSTIKASDMSMDLRGSFQMFEKNCQDEDKLSNHSFQQKQPKSKISPIDQQNKKLRQENTRLKNEVETLTQLTKQIGILRKKCSLAIQQQQRLQGQRAAIVKDKMKYQSLYYSEVQSNQKLRKEIQGLKGSLNQK